MPDKGDREAGNEVGRHAKPEAADAHRASHVGCDCHRRLHYATFFIVLASKNGVNGFRSTASVSRRGDEPRCRPAVLRSRGGIRDGRRRYKMRGGGFFTPKPAA